MSNPQTPDVNSDRSFQDNNNNNIQDATAALPPSEVAFAPLGDQDGVSASTFQSSFRKIAADYSISRCNI